MTATIAEPLIIESLEELQYIQSEPFTQLRFISGTSLNHTFGAICIVYDIDIDAVLVIPYFLKKSHEQLEKIEISENPESLALRLIVKEAEMKSSRVNVLGSPIGVPDKRSLDQTFFKYIVLITNFEPEDRIEIEVNSTKTGKPVWVKRELLRYIFEEKPLINDFPRKHPHLEAYQRFMEDFPLRSELEQW